MKRRLAVVLVTLAVSLSSTALAAAGQRHGAWRAHRFPAPPVPRPWIAPGVPVYGYGYPVSPYQFPSHFYYWPRYPSIIVISPYARPYYYPAAAVVASTRYFCAFHHQGFVSRVGLLDHLAGMHDIPLGSAAEICPDGAADCFFPLP